MSLQPKTIDISKQGISLCHLPCTSDPKRSPSFQLHCNLSTKILNSNHLRKSIDDIVQLKFKTCRFLVSSPAAPIARFQRPTGIFFPDRIKIFIRPKRSDLECIDIEPRRCDSPEVLTENGPAGGFAVGPSGLRIHSEPRYHYERKQPKDAVFAVPMDGSITQGAGWEWRCLTSKKKDILSAVLTPDLLQAQWKVQSSEALKDDIHFVLTVQAFIGQTYSRFWKPFGGAPTTFEIPAMSQDFHVSLPVPDEQ
eukprot:Plantae.Rhodophyta-Hildenbrandia_rubra.ctg1359.p1 GENE.Plantae.Rhodophyta-Hildenbrandia_rubra.ctg1359~~Plantae.Rhodophyta-Hildenbrandia_rubra.ctg1359.p1  ORF type:complete len:252 (+),score=21.13 Plantae.Rhodophyta-Hildenbrandia_rubra.ctg1359:488-1243(+)